MPPENADATDPGAEALDIDHLARLANLPLSTDERDELAQACRDVLDAFHLDAVDAAEPEEPTCPTFGDEAEAWPAEGVERILGQVPQRDGRLLRP